MARRIEKLTAAQTAALPAFRDHGLAVGLSTQTCDRPAAEAAVRAHYVACKRPQPKIIVWFDSPHEGVIAAALLSGAAICGAQVGDQVGAQVGDQVGDQVRAQVRDQVWAQVRDQVRAQVGDQVRAQVRDQVWAQVGDQVRDQVRAQVGDQVRAQVRDQVWAQVRDQVRAQVRDQVRAQVGDQVRAQVRDQVGAQVRDQVWAQVRDQVRDQVRAQVWRANYGSMDMSWAAWAKAHAANGVDLPASAHTLIQVCEQVGWWWAFENAVVMTDRPKAIYRDTSNRLHNLKGMAIEYRDGWGLYVINGVRVPDWLVMHPADVSPEKIKAEPNAEIRRVMAKVYGQHGGDDWIAAIGGTIIDAAAADDARKGLRTGRLWRVKDADGRYHLIDVMNSTPEPDGSIKRYQMVVNGECYGGAASTSLLAAWASTFRDPRDRTRLAFEKPEHALFAVET